PRRAPRIARIARFAARRSRSDGAPAGAFSIETRRSMQRASSDTSSTNHPSRVGAEAPTLFPRGWSPRRAWTVASGTAFLLTALCVATPLPAEEEGLPISLGSWWRYFKGVREPSPDPFTGLPTTAWTRIEFDDSAWLT